MYKSIRREILIQDKARKRRNTLCISSFHTAGLEQKLRRRPKDIDSEAPKLLCSHGRTERTAGGTGVCYSGF